MDTIDACLRWRVGVSVYGQTHAHACRRQHGCQLQDQCVRQALHLLALPHVPERRLQLRVLHSILPQPSQHQLLQPSRHTVTHAELHLKLGRQAATLAAMLVMFCAGEGQIKQL